MKTVAVFLREPRALALPCFKGGPAPYASTILSIISLGRHARFSLAACNDNCCADEAIHQ
jgi:hypothetical protein